MCNRLRCTTTSSWRANNTPGTIQWHQDWHFPNELASCISSAQLHLHGADSVECQVVPITCAHSNPFAGSPPELGAVRERNWWNVPKADAVDSPGKQSGLPRVDTRGAELAWWLDFITSNRFGSAIRFYFPEVNFIKMGLLAIQGWGYVLVSLFRLFVVQNHIFGTIECFRYLLYAVMK